ncbi:DUF4232 domain-containing protein [Streptomyces sp. SID4919]|uniref:DUF4232 domain-containing protein n=1 Tax=unclassified Streptomyces TaxID=2593676 RepID=UPI00082381A2|nr:MULTISPECIES: DUF4232 domain-containing protein [unclassified Streptomyces]MYY12127.1 DUF4232 domain-containing protein [Streptomyces sp. SID4919]SCK44356.1 Protein of unknown function [Streptomyces sp. AmelKG-E11A]
MRVRTVLAASAAATALVLTLPASLAVAAPQGAQAAPAPICREGRVTVEASRTDRPHIIHVRVRNNGDRTCAIDRIPTVTFGDLDGAAQPVPPTGSGPYRVGAGKAAYATVRTIARTDDQAARVVRSVTVAADPSHRGKAFSARSLGARHGVKVYEPVTTWWHTTQGRADRALDRAT